MAGFDPRMPSEDEDFDAVLAPVRQRKPRTPSKPVPNARSEAASAPVYSAAVSEPAQPVEQAEEPVYEESAYEAPAPVVAEYVEPFNQPESLPVPQSVERHVQIDEPADAAPRAPRASKLPKIPRPHASVPMLHMIIEAVLLLAVIGLGLWTWQLYTDKKALRTQVSALETNPQIAIQKQTDDLISTVGSLITLPAGETPTIANVSDATQARKQSAFFNNAENGDKVLMYVKAGEAILYRPSTSKIILVAPLTFNSDSATTAKKP